MKKYLLLLIVLFSVSNLVSAQNALNFRKLGFGIYAGPQLFGKIYNNESLSGISGGTFALDLRYAFSNEPKGFSLHLQPGYNTFRLFFSEGKNTQIYRENTWKWGAFHVPLLARYTFSSGRIRPFVEIGPTLRLRTTLNVRNTGYICGVAGCSGIDQVSDLQSISKDPILITASAGVEIALGKVTIPVAIRIQEGLNTFGMKNPVFDGPYYDGLKTKTVQVTAGISF